MRNQKQPAPALTFESVWALIQESYKKSMEERKIEKKKEAEEKKKEAEERKKEAEERRMERKKEAEERKKEMEERKKENRESKKEMRELKKTVNEYIAEGRRERKKLNQQLGGISNSNGEMAETYFYNAFKKHKVFAQEQYDTIKRNRKLVNGEHDAEFDIILFNGKSVALIEVKYTAKPDNISVRKIISRVEAFKILFPAYKNHNIYLGVAAMSFRKGMEQRLHRNGIATIRQLGKKIVVYDKEMKSFL